MPSSATSLATAIALFFVVPGATMASAEPAGSRLPHGLALPSSVLGGESEILDEMQQRAAAGRPRGGGNFASVTQSGDRNVSNVLQIGRMNVSVVEILSGSGNITNQQQVGRRNESYVAISDGVANVVSTTQVGNDNQLGLELRGTSDAVVIWNQVGNGIGNVERPIVIDGAAPGSAPIVITQTN